MKGGGFFWVCIKMELKTVFLVLKTRVFRVLVLVLLNNISEDAVEENQIDRLRAPGFELLRLSDCCPKRICCH